MTDLAITINTAQLGTLEIPQAAIALTEHTAESVVIEVVTAPVVMEVMTAETVVLEVPALQGPAGPSAADDPTDYAAIYRIAKL